MKVGFARLGRMGQHMVRNLKRTGHDVTVWNRSAEKAHRLAAEVGCAVADTPAMLGATTQVVVTMLADDVASQAVHTGDGGLFAGQGAQVFIEMGTMSPDHIATLVAAAPQRCHRD